MEISSHALDQHRVDNVEVDIAIFSNFQVKKIYFNFFHLNFFHIQYVIVLNHMCAKFWKDCAHIRTLAEPP